MRQPITRLVRNGSPDGYMVRLATFEEKYFADATKVVKTTDGGIDVRNGYITIAGYQEGQFSAYWPVFKERSRAKRTTRSRRTHARF